jgi:hypothetical protein
MIATGRHRDEPAATITGSDLAAVAALIDQANASRRHRGLAPMPALAELARALHESCSFERTLVVHVEPDGSSWVPATEVCRLLHRAPRTVQQWAARGRWSSIKRGGRLYFPAEILELPADTASRPTRAKKKKKSSRTPPLADTAHEEEPAAPAPRRPRTFTFTPRS